MSVIKNTPNFLKHSGLSFTTIINQMMDLIPDDGALGIYCYLASKSENWNICYTHLQNRFKKGRDYIQKKMDILKKVGAIKKQAFRDEKGKIIYWETILINFIETQNTPFQYSSEKVIHTQITENPESGKSRCLEKQALLNKRSLPIKEKIRNKREGLLRKKREALSLDWLPNQNNFDKAKEVSIKCNKTVDQLITKFKNIKISKEATSINWDMDFENFLIDERPSSINTDFKITKTQETTNKYANMRDITQERLDREEREERKSRKN